MEGEETIVEDIFLVDDNQGDIRFIKEAFHTSDFHPTIYSMTTSADALDFLARSREHADTPTPNLILLDWNLPHKTGKGVPPGDSSNDSQHTPTDSMTDDSATDVTRRIELADVEPPADDVLVSIGMDVTNLEIDGDHVGTIKIGFVFTESGQFKTGPQVPIGKRPSNDETPGLILLLHDPDKGPPHVSDDKWKPDRPKVQDWSSAPSRSIIDVADQALLTTDMTATSSPATTASPTHPISTTPESS